MHIGNGGDGQNVGVVNNVTVTNNTVINSLYDGIGFSTSTNTLLQNNTVTSPWRNGIVISPPFYPAPSGSATITGNTVTGLPSGGSAYLNNSGGFTATLSGNSWQGGGGTPEAPYGGTAAAIPGTVQAENYDTGGQGVAYNVTSINGNGTAYRPDGVDLEAASDTGGTQDLGWTATGQWFKYSVNVATAGTYTLSLRIATPAAVTDGFHLANAAGTNLSGNINLPSTGGWQNWSTVTASVTLPAGAQVLTLAEDNGGWNLNYAQFATSGGGGSATLSASPSSLTFGSQTVGTASATQAVTVTNTGTAAATVSGVAATGDFSQTNTCGSSIAAGASCTVTVKFTPTASGTRTGSVSVTSNATNSPLTVALTGTGASAGTATLTASPTSLTFASTNVGSTSAAQTVTVQNTGTVAATVSGTSVTGDYAQTNTCGSSIAAGASCTVSVTFHPTATGTRTGSLTVSSNASNPTLSVALSGTGAGTTPTNLAAGKATSESSHTDVYPSSNVTDGNQASYWESANNAFPQWVQVDLGSSQSASRVVLELPTGWGARNQTLSLLGSTDGTNFSTLKASATYTFDPSVNSNTVTITFTATSDRYFRVNITANTGWPAGQVSEFQVWNS